MARDIMEVVLREEFVLEDRIKFARNQTREAINPCHHGRKIRLRLWSEFLKCPTSGLTEAETSRLAERHGFEALDILEEGRGAGLYRPWEMGLFCQSLMCFHLRLHAEANSTFSFSTRSRIHNSRCSRKVFQQERSWTDKIKVEEEKQLYTKITLNSEMGWRR